ncbi:Holliday junction-specific endonuclease [Metamycoplasma arthritidis]|uniref:Holliday junction resolvase RecU n=1 Tax=Metamycoplasma arthritidis TaxID=2111 RepID=UPI0010051097|nr:Holliday junction resolvase RecU [Metamycoplasma arthritidis]VEU78721.1 Holliday junction-specific endonuclease [Metamycoplasma arthritidis]
MDNTHYKNRGMLLETIINQTNNFYLKHGVCLVHKKNLDIKFQKVELKDRKLITKNAQISHKSTVDYYGLYQGRFLAFEAKSTEDENFSLKNVKKHQLEYLDLVLWHGGLAFWIIYFKIQNEFILVGHETFRKMIQNKKTLNFDVLKAKGVILELQYPGILDYICFARKRFD